jgi:hypothetical protein
MNKLMFLILLALSTCTSANTSQPSSNSINPHPHAHHASSETLFQLVDRVRALKLVCGLAPWSRTFTPPDSTHIILLPGQTLKSMPTCSKADNKGKKRKRRWLLLPKKTKRMPLRSTSSMSYGGQKQTHQHKGGNGLQAAPNSCCLSPFCS